MKKLLLFFILMGAAVVANCQWTTNGSGDAYNNNSSGKVGIGTTAPAAKLHISSADRTQSVRVYFDGNTSNYLSLGQGSGGAVIDPIGTGLLFLGYDQSTNVAMAYGGGKVGIGTASPSARLHITGTGDLWTTSGWSKSIEMPNTSVLKWGGNANGWRFGIGQSEGGLYFVRNGADDASAGARYDMFVSEAGDVGIGTTSPNGLQINSALTGSETTKGVNNIRMGVLGGTPRIILDGASGSTFELDNNAGRFRIFTPSAERFTIDPNGKVGIGTPSPDYPLTVNGSIHAKEVRVDLTGALSVPDYVFEKDYKLPSLDDIKAYIDQNKHLPEVPSAKEIEKNGVQLGEMNLILLKKIEELTLHAIEQNKMIEEMKKEINDLKAKK